jgi:hypothetical protein
MNLSDKEQTFLVRGLDKATTADEADTCAKNFFKELRARRIDGYQFIDQMDYAEYEREIDEQSVKSNQAWDEYSRASAAQQTSDSYWRSGRRKNTETQRPQYFDFSRSHPHKHSPAQKTPNGRIAEMPGGKLLFLLIGSFALAFVFVHSFFATLIFGALLAVPMLCSKWFRRILLVGILWVLGWVFLSSWQGNQQMKQQSEAYAAAQR